MAQPTESAFIALDGDFSKPATPSFNLKKVLLFSGICVAGVVALSLVLVNVTGNHNDDDAAIEESSKLFGFGSSRSKTDPPAGVYFRPPSDQTAGFSGTNKKFKRSPCPALNTLANHGYLPRDGEDLTITMLGNVLLDKYNLDWKIGAGLGIASRVVLKKLPWQELSLSDLSTHNAIEHDASLFHYDLSTGRDPSEANVEWVNQLVAMSPDGEYVGLDEIIEFRKARVAQSISSDSEYSLDDRHNNIAIGEAALLIRVLGRDNRISIHDLKSFVMDERIPDGWTKSNVVMTLGLVQPTIDAITKGLKQESAPASLF
jgi:hypothetical protein